MMEKYIFSKFQNELIFWKKIKIIRFVNVETDPRLHTVNHKFISFHENSWFINGGGLK
jgi:hypothetical protein